MKKIKQAILDKILYVGNEIPEGVANDKRPKFVVLGTPQELIDETTKSLEIEKIDIYKHIAYHPFPYRKGGVSDKSTKTKKEKETLIKWAKKEIEEYQKFILRVKKLP